jgi:hypothetical protein
MQSDASNLAAALKFGKCGNIQTGHDLGYESPPQRNRSASAPHHLV